MGLDKVTAEFQGLAEAIVEGDIDKAHTLAERLLKRQVKPEKIVTKGLTKGMILVGQAWDRGEAFLTNVLVALDTFNSTMELVKPHLAKRRASKPLGRIVIGTVAGDIHFVGKNIVANMFEVHSFEVIDLGEDVSPAKFATAIDTLRPNILAMSCLISTSMLSMKETIELLEERGLRQSLIVMVGGPPITEDFLKQVGADITAKDAFEAVAKARKVLEVMKH